MINTIFLELTPPARANKNPLATQQLFAVLHHYNTRKARCLSFEIVSTKPDGVRYIVQVPAARVGIVQQAILTYLPDIRVRVISDYLSPERDGSVVQFTQTGHYGFPLAIHDGLSEYDPVAYLTGAISKLEDNELMSLQLVVKPIKPSEAKLLAHRLLRNEDVLSQLTSNRRSTTARLMKFINGFMFGILDFIGLLVSGGSSTASNAAIRANNERLRIAAGLQPARVLSKFEQQLMESVHAKLTQPLFSVSIRAYFELSDSDKEQERLETLGSSLGGYSTPGYQALQQMHGWPFIRKYRLRAFRGRLPARRGSDCILSASEVASLYHFPDSYSTRTDNLVSSLSRTLPAPVSLKQNKRLAVIIGQNEHHGTSTAIGLTELERERHVYIIGGTGNGKTTMLQYAIVQDMQHGKGLAVVDPHGDMAETLLRHVPPERLKDVVYFNPDDLEYPIGLNLLELTPGLTGNELLREKDIITESVVSVFRKIFSEEDTGGHRIEYVLRNTVQTALTIPDATLFTVFDLLNDPKYRKGVIKTLEDKNLSNFWKHELGKAGDMQKVKMAAGITAKIGRFLFSASAKQILEQPKSTIDFDDIINSGKILICNFSKGLLGEDTSELFGITVLAKLQLASLRRARIAQMERRAFYLYVDEFQNFATASFVQMLSESRKYKLLMVMAEQSTSQQKDQQMVSIILANVGTVICFRTGNPQDERLLLPLFSPYIEQGEISNLSAFNFYAKLSAIQAQEPLSGQTLLIANDGDDKIARSTIENSRRIFARQHPAKVIETPSYKPNRQLEEKQKPRVMLDT